MIDMRSITKLLQKAGGIPPLGRGETLAQFTPLCWFFIPEEPRVETSLDARFKWLCLFFIWHFDEVNGCQSVVLVLVLR